VDSSAFNKFNQLCQAIRHQRVALLECVGTPNEPDVALICEVRRLTNGLAEFIPLAQVFREPLDALLLPVVSTLDELSAGAT